jgi:hypothetical protein
MDCAVQPLRESSANLLRATSAQLYDRGVKVLATLIVALTIAGCGRDHEADLPDACSSPPEEIVAALNAAPGAVRVEGVAISDCFARDSSAGDVQVVGAALLGAAERLGREGDELALGYLVGAARRGAKESQGIHLELVRRLEQEAQPFRESAGFERGVRAGRSSG